MAIILTKYLHIYYW